MGKRSKNAQRCLVCRMHKVECICKGIPSLETTTHIALLIHTKEKSKVSATGPLALTCLPNSTMHVHGLKDAPITSKSILRNGRRPLLLYPDDNAVILTKEWLKKDSRPIDLLVPDGNWRQASRMPKRIKALKNVECVKLPSGGKTNWGLRHEPKEDGLATFEAIARSLGIIESQTIQLELERFFSKMVNTSLKVKNQSQDASPKERERLSIIHQDEHIVVVNKPPGMSVHRGWDRSSSPLLQILRDQLNTYLFPVHRLDKGTSGVLVFAFDQKSAHLLQEQFVQGGAQKMYLTLCRGKNDAIKEINYPLSKVVRRGKINQGTKKHATTALQFLGSHGRYGLYSASPKTGRTHQLRIHLSQIGHPIIGDKLYGKEGSILKHKGLFLAAVRLQFVHPITFEKLDIKIEMPYKFQSLLEREKRRWEKFKL